MVYQNRIDTNSGGLKVGGPEARLKRGAPLMTPLLIILSQL